MSDCTHDCSTCGESCGERKEVNVFEKKPLRPGCRVGKVYGIVSGKGGVGKSMVTSQLAVAVRREGYNVGRRQISISLDIFLTENVVA